MPHLHVQRIQKHDAVERLQRPVLPGPRLLHHPISDFADQAGADLDLVHLLQMPRISRVVIPRAYRDRILSSNPVQRVWFFLTICGSNSPLRSRGVAISTSPKSPFSVLRVTPFRLFPLLSPCRIVLFVAQMLGHLALHSPFHHRFGELLQKRVNTFRFPALLQ